MKLPGVSGVYDYAGPGRNSRYRSRPYCLTPTQKRQRPDCIFSELNTQPTCTPVYASPYTSRCTTQNSGPSGSLLLSRRTLPFPASCRFIPAHCIGDLSRTQQEWQVLIPGFPAILTTLFFVRGSKSPETMELRTFRVFRIITCCFPKGSVA